MNKIIYLLAICLVVVSCNTDVEDKEYISPADAETEACLRDGITADPESATIELCLWHWPAELTATCPEYWVDVRDLQDQESPTTSNIEITLTRNERLESRTAVLTLTAGGATREIKIIQRAEPRMETDEALYFASNEGGDLGIRLKSNVSGEIEVKTNCGDNPDWIRFEEVFRDHVNPGKPECVLHFKTSANDGFGRICGVTVSAKGSGLSTRFCIIQQPRLFDEDETIAIDNAGSLDILLGTDIDNIRRVRRLTLTGEMNSIDWSALRRLFYQGAAADPKPEQYLVSLDLRQISSVCGDRSYYHSLGYTPTKPECLVWQNNEIPAHALELCSNLAGLVIPDKTTKIGAMAIAKNDRLNAIGIPDNVEIIENGAFQNCRQLKEINISDKSKLRHLGRYAFFGCGPIEYLNLPISLTDTDGGYLNFSVKELKVHWPTPPELRVPPTVKEGSKLYVPEGSLDKYKEAFGWDRFPTIVVFPD